MQDDLKLDDTGPPAWLEPVRRRIAGWISAGTGTDWLVAVSGGSDSVGLLLALHRLAPSLGLRLSVAHLNHNVRGEQARDDARFVESMANALGLPVDVGQWRPSRSGHFEVDARAARYAWLRETAQARGASVVAVGHTSDDQAETILHRILRGAGPRGLAGIPARRPLGADRAVMLVRPFLGVSRQQVRDELARLGQGFREDPTNLDVSHTRARIRHELLPQLAADYNPQVAAALVRLGALAAASQQALDAHLAQLETTAVRSIDGRRIALDLRSMAVLSPFLIAEIVRRAWRTARWPEMAMTARRWRRIADLIAESRPTRVHVGEGVSLQIDEDAILFDKKPTPTAPPDSPITPVTLVAPGSIAVPWADARLKAQIVADASSEYDETIDLSRIVFPLTIRPPKPGDLFAPLGMSGRRVPLRDFLRNRRIPRDERRGVPLVCDQDGIIWVVGHRIADRVRITEETTQRLGLRWATSR